MYVVTNVLVLMSVMGRVQGNENAQPFVPGDDYYLRPVSLQDGRLKKGDKSALFINFGAHKIRQAHSDSIELIVNRRTAGLIPFNVRDEHFYDKLLVGQARS